MLRQYRPPLTTAPKEKAPLLSEGVRAMIYAALAFSVMSALVKLSGARLPTMQIVLARAVATLLLSGVGIARRRISPWGERKGLLLLRGVLGFVALSCFFWAVTHLTLADATVLHFTNPILTAILAALLLGESFGRRTLMATVGGLIGVILVVQPAMLFGGESRLESLGVGIALAGAFFAAGAYTTVRRLGRTEDPLVVVFYFSLVAVPATLPFVVADWVWPTPLEWVALAGLGVATQVGQVQMTRGLRLERAGKATAISYLQVVFAFAFGAMLFGETPNLIGVAGALLVIAAAFVAASARR